MFGTIAPAIYTPSLANSQTVDGQTPGGPGGVVQIVICTPSGLRSVDVTIDPETGDWTPVEGGDLPLTGATEHCPGCLGPQFVPLGLLPCQTAISVPYPPFTYIVLSPAEAPLQRRGLGIGNKITPRAPPLSS